MSVAVEGEEAGAEEARAMGWAEIAQEARFRIFRRDWAPGQTIPREEDLAREFGVSRTTVGRALRTLAEEGWLDRRKRAGTVVATRPVGRATFDIPLIRDEVERTGRRYKYEFRSKGEPVIPDDVRQRMGITRGPRVVRILARHLASGRPYAFEERWINGGTVPEALKVNWSRTSPNEWLVRNVPYTRVETSICASEAGPLTAQALNCLQGEAVLISERTTWSTKWSVTYVRFFYAPGHRMWSLT